MKKYRRIIFIFLSLIIFNPLFSQSVIDKVNLFICTEGDHGQLDPSATVPWGMIKVGPDTDPGNHSGYDYSAIKIKGFSHNRIGGVGCSGAGGNLRVLPGLGDSNILNSLFDKTTEIASPGYYSVIFNNNIKTELTATNHTAIHRYTFPQSDSAFINFDLSSSFAEFISASAIQLNKQEFTASISAKNVCNRGRYTAHYHVKCNKEVLQVKKMDDQLRFQFKTDKDEVVELYVTVSSISTDDAQQEWYTTQNKLSFQAVLNEARVKWTNLLSKIEVEGKEEYVQLFYTHLYHLFLNPVETSNRNGQFKATNGEIHTSEDYTHYDTWSMWDNFRNKFSIYSLIIPEISTDICRSLEDLYRYGIPFWSGYNEAAPTVRTEHSIITLLDFYTRGITDFDVDFIYNSMCVEIDKIPEGAPDAILEKSYDFWVLSEFARLLNKPEDQKVFLDQAMKYQETWNKYFSVMDKESDVMHAKGLYEGTIWQYRWHVQFDIEGLIGLFGGKENYTKQLEYFFDNNLYNHGNQPDIHVPFMFNFGDKPWLTQQLVNKILTKKMYQYYGTHRKWETPYFGHIYSAKPAGYIPEMDDDEGTMSAWYVLSSMGLYPVTVGKPEFQLSSPIFSKIVIHLEEGRKFEIITKNLSDNNFYIESAKLNGNDFNQLFIEHKDIAKGGKLVYKLSNIPKK